MMLQYKGPFRFDYVSVGVDILEHSNDKGDYKEGIDVHNRSRVDIIGSS